MATQEPGSGCSPDVRVSCARFQDTGKANFLDKLDFEGSVFEALENVPQFIIRNSRLFPKITGMIREDIPAYPVSAIREILVNSIVHCDYSLIWYADNSSCIFGQA